MTHYKQEWKIEQENPNHEEESNELLTKNREIPKTIRKNGKGKQDTDDISQ